MTQMTPFEADAAASGGARTPVLLAAGLAAALALGGGGYFLLSGSDEPEASAPVTFGVTKTTRPAAKQPAAKPAVKTVPVVAKAQLGRDPFRALYVEPSTTGAAAGGAPTTTTPTTTTPGTAPAGPSTVPGTTVGAEYPLRLNGVSKNGTGSTAFYVASFSVAGEPKSVIAGQRFGKYGELVVLGFGANSKGKVVGVVLQVGDDSPIEVLIGERISVK